MEELKIPDKELASLNEVGYLLMHAFISDCFLRSSVDGFDTNLNEWVEARIGDQDVIAGYPKELLKTEIKKIFLKHFDKDFLKPLTKKE